MQNETSKFKWMEDLNKEDLHQAVSNLSLIEKADLVSEVLESDINSENNLKVVVVAQSQIISDLTGRLSGCLNQENISNKIGLVEGTEKTEYTAAEVDALKCLVKTVDELDSGSENSKMHSVLGMIATLIEDDYLNKLDSILRENFQDYYLNNPAA